MDRGNNMAEVSPCTPEESWWLAKIWRRSPVRRRLECSGWCPRWTSALACSHCCGVWLACIARKQRQTHSSRSLTWGCSLEHRCCGCRTTVDPSVVSSVVASSRRWTWERLWIHACDWFGIGREKKEEENKKPSRLAGMADGAVKDEEEGGGWLT